ncbi:hypothetical protein Nmel_001793 [Mimus melanotis]
MMDLFYPQAYMLLSSHSLLSLPVMLVLIWHASSVPPCEKYVYNTNKNQEMVT